MKTIIVTLAFILMMVATIIAPMEWFIKIPVCLLIGYIIVKHVLKVEFHAIHINTSNSSVNFDNPIPLKYRIGDGEGRDNIRNNLQQVKKLLHHERSFIYKLPLKEAAKFVVSLYAIEEEDLALDLYMDLLIYHREEFVEQVNYFAQQLNEMAEKELNKKENQTAA